MNHRTAIRVPSGCESAWGRCIRAARAGSSLVRTPPPWVGQRSTRCSRYVYDDLRLTFARHGDGEYLVRAERGSRQWNGTFRLPLPSHELDHDAVLYRAGNRCRGGRTSGVTE